jgi:hypothetical protein
MYRSRQRDPFMCNQLSELDVLDTKMYDTGIQQKISNTNSSLVPKQKPKTIFVEDIEQEKNKEKEANTIRGTYSNDYDILSIHEIIKNKLKTSEVPDLEHLQSSIKTLKTLIGQPQTYIMRKKTLNSIAKLEDHERYIVSGKRYQDYIDKTLPLIEEYKTYNRIKTWVFSSNMEADDTKNNEMDIEGNKRVTCIEKFLVIASTYISIDIVREQKQHTFLCTGCGASIAEVSPSLDGTIICPDESCSTEHNYFSLSKSSKDSMKIYSGSSLEDDSIENFLRAFVRYQGWQNDYIDPVIFEELDNYFKKNTDFPSREDILSMPLNARGKRGDTNNLMLNTALSEIKRSEYIESCNLIGHLYWGWTLPNVMQYKSKLIDHYYKTQKVFYQIPIEERERVSSLGTQFRLWRGLQLVGHECYMDDFKIAENSDSLSIHNKLWKLMCEGAGDPEIQYIE